MTGGETFVSVLQAHATQAGHREALTFLDDTGAERDSVTYPSLDRRARAVAATLSARVQPGDRVMLLFPPGIDYVVAFLGCLYARAIAVPTYPPKLNRTAPALGTFATDCDAALLLSQASILREADALFADDPAALALPRAALDDIDTTQGDSWEGPGPDPAAPAFIQYTSGSTAAPKGVLLSHRNLRENLRVLERLTDPTPDDKAVVWLPPYHDMGLIGGILEPLFAGSAAVLMSPLAFLQRPYVWLEAISRYRGTLSAAPNFAYDLTTRKVTPEERKSLDLSTWRVAINGAEPIHPETLRRFVAAFGPCGFDPAALCPAFGLAEATLIVTASPPATVPTVRTFRAGALDRGEAVLDERDLEVLDDARELVSCGAPLDGQRVEVVDPVARRVLPEGRIGEIWVSGPCASGAYWGKPGETETSLRARLADSEDSTLFLRTGDLGFLDGGELYVTGRLKDLIVIAGRNVHPHDIERVAELSHPSLRRGCGIAFPVAVDAEERVAIVHEVDARKAFDTDEVARAIVEAVSADLQIRPHTVVLVERGQLPKTSSGKKRRRRCREELEAGSLRELGSWREAPGPGVEAGSATGGPAPTADEIGDWLSSKLAALLHIPAADVDRRRPLVDFGVSSLEATEIADDVGTWLGRRLSATLIFDHPSIDAVAQHLGRATPAPAAPRRPVGERASEPIAVVGLSCRFPGAPDAAAFRELLRSGGDAVREVPPDRWDVDALYDPEPGADGKMNSRWLAHLDGIDQFDPHFFGISPREAAAMDPQQRLLLEVVWGALEDGAIAPERLRGSRTGVFVGIGGMDYPQRQAARPRYREALDAYSGTGNAHSVAANRLSFLLDLRGPSFAVDTACSSSLVAAHLACQSLKRGESDVGIAAGVNVIITPDTSIAFAHARMLASDGRCKTFDAQADGYVRGEGCGAVVLKRLSDALRDGDRIHALIAGSAVNQDGQTNGLTAPSSRAQQEVMACASHEAGVDPGRLTLFEAHGTGTPLGDPIEVESIARFMGTSTAPAGPCWLGSVKANIGHLECASGMAGLIKVILALEHGEVYPQIHLTKLNPRISLDSTRLRIPRELQHWEAAAGPRLAGLNSFGFGGTNAHLIVEEAPPPAPTPPRIERPRHLLVLSGRDEQALAELASRYADALPADDAEALADVCFTAQVGRAHFEERAAVVGATSGEIRQKLAHLAQGRPTRIAVGRARPRPRPKVGFLFTGQGAQYPGMGRALYELEPVFRAAVDQCAALADPYLERPLLSVLYGAHAEDGSIDRTANTQPAVFAVDYALAELWRSWGVEPAVVCGHSLGEYAAACVAGVFGLEDAMRLIAERARLMQALPAGGAMAVVIADESTVAAAVATQTDVAIAAVNGPENYALSGPAPALAEVLACFEEGVVTHALNVSHAMHSPLVEPMLDDFERCASGLSFEAPRIPLVSNLTGRLFAPGEAPDALYWRSHLRRTVDFAGGIAAMAEAGCSVYIEVGPHPTLLGLARLCLPREGQAWLPSLRRGEVGHDVLLHSLGEAYVHGVEIDWEAHHRRFHRHRVSVPAYPFQRTRHWFRGEDVRDDTAAVVAPAGDSVNGSGSIAGSRLALAHPAIQSSLGVGRLGYLGDHRVRGSVILPATAYMEMAIAASAVHGAATTLSGLVFHRPLALPADAAVRVQTIVSPDDHGPAHVRIYCDSEADGWLLLASGRVGAAASAVEAGETDPADPAALRATATEEIAGPALYEALRSAGLEYGPCFQAVQRVWRSDGEAVAELLAPPQIEGELASHHFHPALLDACLHTVAPAARPLADLLDADGWLALPVGVERLHVERRPVEGEHLWAHASLRGSVSEDDLFLEADVRVHDAQGRPVAAVLGLRMQRLEPAKGHAAERAGESWLYRQEWASQPRRADPRGDAADEPWLVLGAGDGLGASIAAHLREARATCVADTDPVALDVGDALAAAGAGSRARVNVVYLGGIDVAELGARPDAAAAIASERLVDVIRAIVRVDVQPAPRLIVVTRGAVPIDGGEEAAEETSLAQAALWGIARSLAHEHPELDCLALDVGDPAAESHVAVVDEILTSGAERLVALRGEARYVARLVRRPGEGRSAEDIGERRIALPNAATYVLETSGAGVLENLVARTRSHSRPTDGQVEIAVSAAGLNFRDVMKAMGVYPTRPGDPFWLGDECAGTVTAVGPGVDGVQVGDEVMAVAPACFGTHATTVAGLVVPKPAGLSFEQAAASPIAFCTAWHALKDLGRLEAGERCLIHAAAGGVGLAAVQTAQLLGAEVFATAGSDEKRDHLRSLGVEHVMDSRSLEFADEVRELTDGAGVDVVLNSLAGEAISKSLSVLRAFGRFLEIGKRDIYQNARLGLYPFQNSLSFSAIDLDRFFRERPAGGARLLRTVASMLGDGTLEPLPVRTYPLADARDAFRHLARAKNTGKVVLALESSDRDEGARGAVRADASYLVTGGLGALGLQVARSLANQGATHVVLVSRHDPDAEARAAIDALRARGIEVTVRLADVTSSAAVEELVASITEPMPPLRGVVHAAGIVRDSFLVNLDAERLRSVVAPKAAGAWNLHRATAGQELDFFVMFSSGVALLGSPGQANYAAANAFLDALAHHRHARGEVAQAIDWGAWSEIGMAAMAGKSGSTLVDQVGTIPPEAGIDAFERLLVDGEPQVAVLPIDWERWSSLFPASARTPLLSELVPDDEEGNPAGASAGLLRAVLATEGEGRETMLQRFLTEEIAGVLQIDPDLLEPSQPLNTVGLDSLMALELKNRVAETLEVELSVVALVDGPSIAKLSALLADLLPVSRAGNGHDPAAEDVTPEQAEDILGRLDHLSDDEVDSLLAEIAPTGAGGGDGPA
jgi:acyl transferase domain-containing protein/acyl-CoA synthetase (AMP-forming)/AMP-acid ligase II/Zn-dependent alcohol dehydrogenase/NADP-dependent 3-hydroxy acid dehydrogenase YdfG/acyl carrier protein